MDEKMVERQEWRFHKEQVRDASHALEVLDDVDSLVRFCATNMSDTDRYQRGGEAMWRVAHWIATIRFAEPEFQPRVQPWLMACFGDIIAGDLEERNHRFLEEALELVQSCGCTAHEAHQLVDYVYGRDAGDPPQEVGGVMVTLAALCLAHGLNMHQNGETELARIWTKVETIRAKQAAKPKHSPLPA